MVERARWLQRLGVASGERALVVHVDDVGMCQATVAAFDDLVAKDAAMSASAMPTCSWLPAVAASCHRHARCDVGVHLTLTSEWPKYRWGPLVPGALGDEAGYFPPSARRLQRSSLADWVGRELRAQVARALSVGIDVTHVDSHMFALFHPALFHAYASVAHEFRVPCVLPPFTPLARSLVEGLSPGLREHVLLFDAWAQLPLSSPNRRLEIACRILDALPEGISLLISHPATDTPELRAIADDWEARVADYELLIDDGWRRALEASRVRVVGMKAARAALPQREGLAS